MKHKKIGLLLISLFSVLLLNTSTAAASVFYIYDYYDTWSDSWSDADKTSETGDGDDWMCWAAAASNILYWSGWANVDGESFTDSQDIFEYFQDYWTDQGSSVYYAWEWWFEGTNGSYYSSYEDQIEYDGGGNFWSADYLDDSFLWTSIDQYADLALSFLLNNGYGVSLSLTGSTNHAITCWGYKTDEDGTITGIYVTDSDDRYDGIQYYDINFDDEDEAWYLSGYSNDSYYITEVLGLKISSVPAPTTALLLGLGILGLAGVLREKAAPPLQKSIGGYTCLPLYSPRRRPRIAHKTVLRKGGNRTIACTQE